MDRHISTVKSGTPAGRRLQVLDSRSSPELIRAALNTRSGLLAIATHSDGIDAFLGPSLTLCAIDAGGASAANDRAPSCWLSGYCHRHGVSVPEFRKLGVSVNPADVSAGILIFDTCFGTLTAQGPIDSRWGLGRHLIENLAIGATVTTWELTLLDARKLEKFVVDLKSGMTLGRAVARFNRSEIARRTAARLAVFGDPETRAATRSQISDPPARLDVPRAISRSRVTESSELRELGFSRAYLEHGIASLTANVANCRTISWTGLSASLKSPRTRSTDSRGMNWRNGALSRRPLLTRLAPKSCDGLSSWTPTFDGRQMIGNNSPERQSGKTSHAERAERRARLASSRSEYPEFPDGEL